MLGVLLLVVLAMEILFFSRLDRKLFGTWITPFCVLAYPYFVVVCLAYFLSGPLDFVPLYPPSLLIWIVGLGLTWAAGAFLGWGLLDIRSADGPKHSLLTFPPSSFSNAQTLATGLAWVTLPVMGYGLLASVRAAGGWSQIGSLEFKAAYSSGIHGHAMVLSALLAIVLIGRYRRGKPLQLLTTVLLLLLITLSQVKGNIVLVIVGGMLFRLMEGSMRFSLKKAAALIAVTYLVFNAIYLIGMLILSPTEALDGATYSFLARHYLYYLFAGPLALGEAVRFGITDVGGDWSAVFAPLINLSRVILGNHSLVAIGSADQKGMITDPMLKSPLGTNVYTFFGTSYLYLGVAGAVLYVIVAGFLCYGLLLIAKHNREIWLTGAYCFIAAQLSMGFFELYFWHLDTYEVLVLGTLLVTGSRYYRRFGGWRLQTSRAS